MARMWASHCSTWSQFQMAGATTEKARLLIDVLMSFFGMTTKRSIAWEDLVAHVDDIGERCSNKYQGPRLQHSHTRSKNKNGSKKNCRMQINILQQWGWNTSPTHMVSIPVYWQVNRVTLNAESCAHSQGGMHFHIVNLNKPNMHADACVWSCQIPTHLNKYTEGIFRLAADTF